MGLQLKAPTARTVRARFNQNQPEACSDRPTLSEAAMMHKPWRTKRLHLMKFNKEQASLTDIHSPLFYNIGEARRILGGIGLTKFYALRASGRIRTCKLGTRTLVPASELYRFAAEIAQENES